MTSDTRDVFCPKCNILVAARSIAKGFGGTHGGEAGSPLDGIDVEYHGDHYIVAQCGRCSQPFLIRESVYTVLGEGESTTHVVVLFPSTGRQQLEHLPAHVAGAFDQAQRCFNAALYEPCALMARKCVEGVASVFGVSGANLKARIEALERAGHINSQLSQWAHEVRLLGNDAAHEVTAPVNKDDARDVLEFTEALLMYVFTLSVRFKEFKARRAGKPNP